jgi:hypothetical protein
MYLQINRDDDIRIEKVTLQKDIFERVNKKIACGSEVIIRRLFPFQRAVL